MMFVEVTVHGDSECEKMRFGTDRRILQPLPISTIVMRCTVPKPKTQTMAKWQIIAGIRARSNSFKLKNFIRQ